LRLRFGDAEAEIRGDLELQELERQQQQEAKQRVEAAKEAEAALKRADAIEPQVEPPAEPQLPAASFPAPLLPVAPPPSAPAPPL
jgi:sRNA-binding protein